MSCVLCYWNKKIKYYSSVFAQSTIIERVIFSFSASIHPFVFQRMKVTPILRSQIKREEKAPGKHLQNGKCLCVTWWLIISGWRRLEERMKRKKQLFLNNATVMPPNNAGVVFSFCCYLNFFFLPFTVVSDSPI